MVQATLSWELLEAYAASDEPPSGQACAALGDEIVRCEVLIGGAQYRQLLCLRLFHAGYGYEGYPSLEGWLSVKAGWNYRTANERVRVARALGRLPKIDGAFRRGELSYTKVRALHDVATPENEHALLDQARHATGEQLRHLLKPLRAAARRATATHAEREAKRRVAFHDTEDGMGEVFATLLVDEMATVRKAIEVAIELGIKNRLKLPAAESAAADPAAEGLASSEAASRACAPFSEVASRSAAADLAPEGLASSSQAASTRQAASSSQADSPESASPERASSARPAPSAALGPAAEGLAPSDGESSEAASRSAAADHTDEGLASSKAASPERASPARPADSAAADQGHGRFTRADALVLIAEAFLKAPSLPGVSPTRRELLIHTVRSEDAPHFGEGVTETGAVLSPETVSRLACHAGERPVLRSPEGQVLDVGRHTRRVSRRLELALLTRDRCCSFPGCTRAASLDAHHLTPWGEGGETKLGNLTLLCRLHHRAVHEGGWSVRLGEGNELVFVDPKGEVLVPERLPQVHATEAQAQLVADLRARGVEPDPRLLVALSHGETLRGYDYQTLMEATGYADPDPGQILPPAIRWLLDQDQD